MAMPKEQNVPNIRSIHIVRTLWFGLFGGVLSGCVGEFINELSPDN